jgi:hypothetical protein
VLKTTDLVLAVNFCGSALIHGFGQAKATIFYWTDPLLSRTDPHPHAEVYLPGGMLAREPSELWALVWRFFTDPEAASQMQLRAREFRQNCLDDINYRSLVDAIDYATGTVRK